MKRAVSWCLLVLLSCVGLVACGTGPAGPSPSPPPTTPASATASPSPSAVAKAVYKPATATSKALNVPVPVMPEAAKKETPDGAKAFVGYWFSALSFGYETGDTSAIAKNSETSCEICNIAPNTIRKVYQGGWLVGGQLRVPSIEVRSHPSSSKVILVAQVIQSSAHVQRATSAGKVYGETNESLACEVIWSAGQWKMATTKKITS